MTRDFLERTFSNILIRTFGLLLAVWLSVSWMVYLSESRLTGANIKSYPDALWWGLVTVATVGYGDMFPMTTAGRIWASVLMISGIVVIGIITAKISSIFLEQVLRKERGLMKPESLQNHFIVCGFKDDMDLLFLHILDFNAPLESDRIVWVANVEFSLVQELRAHPRLKNLQFVRGDFSHEIVLSQARPEKARKVLILADRAPLANGAIPSMKETDSRTLMTSMLISHMARGIPVSAEVLDPTMDPYLKMANVSEVIYSREYNRLLIANASGQTGISNVIYELLNPLNPTVITSVALDEKYVGEKFGKIKSDYEKQYSQMLVIGILENTGNSYALKESALKKAQRTADVGNLVANLKAVKTMRFNHPVLSPSKDYVVTEGSTLIVIENRQRPNNGDTVNELAQ
jgi:voltage-gated potassium channel